METHQKKMIAPIVVTVLMVAYYALYFGFLMVLLQGVWKYILGIVPIVFSMIMVGVCTERINEIKKGEEDDLGQY